MRYDDFPEGAESGFARTVCAARRFFPGVELVKAAHFIHSEPPYRAEYDRIFRIPIVFGSDRNAMLTDAAWLDQGLQAPSLQMVEMVKARTDRLLHRIASANSTRSRVEALLTNRCTPPTSASTRSRANWGWVATRCFAG